MISTITSETEDLKKTRLPWRDWILLPSLAFLTIGLILIVAECIALRMFPDPSGAKWTKLGDCLTENSTDGIRAIPNTVCHAGVWESGPVEYKFNRCGHRDDKDCGSKPEGTYRIVMLGTSTALGWSVPREKSFAALLPEELSRDTGRKVDLYNESMMYQSPLGIIHRFDEVLGAKPDMILWTFPPNQALNASVALPEHGNPQATNSNEPNGLIPSLLYNARTAFTTKQALPAARELWSKFRSSRIQFMLQHYLYESQTEFVKSYLKGPEAEYLKTDPDEKVKSALPAFEACVAQIGERSKAAGVPLVVVMLPFRAQAAMISMGEWPAGYDPYKFDNELRAIFERHGATYVSILPDYRNVPNPERDYFPVDGHPTTEGHAVIAGMLERELTSGAIPALRPAQPQSSPEHE